MIKIVISCILVLIATAAATYEGANWKLQQTVPSAAPKSEKLQYHKTKTLNVPMIARGAVQGYVVVQFGYTETDKGATLPVPPDAFLLDEAFRIIYADPKLDFRHLEKYDVAGLTKELVKRVNRRLNDDVVKEVLVEEINFVASKDISH